MGVKCIGKFKRIDLFSPLILIVVIFFYVLLAVVGTQYHLMGLNPVSILTYIYIIYGCLIFISGYLVAKLIEKYMFKRRIGEGSPGEVIKSFVDYIENNEHFKEISLLFWVLFSLVLQSINLYLMGGVPLFSGYLKAASFNPVTVLSYMLFMLSINVMMAKFYHRKYFLLVFIGLILFTATGYRATSIGIVLSVLITIFYTRGNKIKYFIILTPIIIVLGLIVGYIACMSIEWQQWHVNPLSLVFIRAGYTLSILDKIVHLQNPNHGMLTYSILTGFFKSVDPRLVLGQLVLKYDTSITSTIFGPAILEFGYIGLAVQMFFLGMILELLHYLQKIKKGIYTSIYAIGLAHTIIWVETSPADLTVWIYYIVTIILILHVIINLIIDPLQKPFKF